ncbi:organic solute transporter subunit alpha-like [Mizuhopecten yessoensis]|uniref:Organic solute transporter subunit alpha n=1 Tax=Mizuhopecten yessoensis TaxID=6573 RepID=A0A210PRF5_MIZYE|nr:organic solute transporter subunit alpha-like [Mizuhopecten yessoensis]OWF39085.1 Organic solute transporter subunit alpha [Mizuhopecten yessoensis]
MSCSQDFPYTSVLYSELGGETGTIAITVIAGVLSFLTLINFLEEVWFFSKHYDDKQTRPKILCLLALYPIVSCNALLSLLIPKATPIAEFLSALFLSFCVLQFIRLVADYFGGTNAMVQAFEGETVTFRTPPCCCCCCCLTQVKLTRKTLKFIKIIVLQLSFVRPGILYVLSILHSDGRYHLDQSSEPSQIYLWLKVISTISTLFAIYGLVVTFFAARRKLSLPRFHLKAATLKLTLLVFDMQLTILLALARYEKITCEGSRGSFVRSISIHNFMLIIEVFLIAVLARFAYRFTEQQTAGIETKEMKQMKV